MLFVVFHIGMIFAYKIGNFEWNEYVKSYKWGGENH